MSEYYVKRDITPEFLQDGDAGMVGKVLLDTAIELVKKWYADVEREGLEPAVPPMMTVSVRGLVRNGRDGS